ncbi:MAG: hypothetical protein J6M21_07775 [Campylobacter sp.]|nr:hypothetical protein [Campylobacter sp.]
MFKKYNFLKYIFLLLVSFEISFAFSSNTNLSYLNQASINIIENCLNSNISKIKCKDTKFIKENLRKQGFKFDNKTLQNSIKFAINFIENQNNKNDILTNYAISISPKIDDKIPNPISKSNSNNKIEIYLSNENSDTNKTTNLQNLDDENSLNSKISDINLKAIEVKDKNLSNDTVFLISSNDINLHEANKENLKDLNLDNNKSQFDTLLILNDHKPQEYTQENKYAISAGKKIFKKFSPVLIGAGRKLLNNFRNGTASKNGIENEFVKKFMKQCLQCHSMEELKQKVGESFENKNDEDIIGVFLDNNPEFLKKLKDGLNDGTIHPNLNDGNFYFSDTDKKYKKPKSGSGKDKSSDKPSWADGERPYIGENGKDFAKRLMDKKYGKGNWKDTGPKSEYNKLKKWGDRGFE